MKSRIVQDQPDPGGAEPSGSKPSAPAHEQSRVARIGRWSAQHRKKAILGWLAFVVFAFMAGNAIGPQNSPPSTRSAVSRTMPRSRPTPPASVPTRRSCSSTATS